MMFDALRHSEDPGIAHTEQPARAVEAPQRRRRRVCKIDTPQQRHLDALIGWMVIAVLIWLALVAL